WYRALGRPHPFPLRRSHQGSRTSRGGCRQQVSWEVAVDYRGCCGTDDARSGRPAPPTRPTRPTRTLLHVVDLNFPHVKAHVEAPGTDRRSVDAQDDLLPARVSPIPRVRPHAPGDRRLGPRALLDARPPSAP